MKYKKLILDIKKRKFYNNTEIFQKVLKTLFLYSKDNIFKLLIKKKIYYTLFKKYYKTTIKNYCIITGRSKGIYRKFKVSRIIFRLLGNQGLFFGIKKISW